MHRNASHVTRRSKPYAIHEGAWVIARRRIFARPGLLLTVTASLAMPPLPAAAQADLAIGLGILGAGALLNAIGNAHNSPPPAHHVGQPHDGGDLYKSRPRRSSTYGPRQNQIPPRQQKYAPPPETQKAAAPAQPLKPQKQIPPRPQRQTPPPVIQEAAPRIQPPNPLKTTNARPARTDRLIAREAQPPRPNSGVPQAGETGRSVAVPDSIAPANAKDAPPLEAALPVDQISPVSPDANAKVDSPTLPTATEEELSIKQDLLRQAEKDGLIPSNQFQRQWQDLESAKHLSVNKCPAAPHIAGVVNAQFEESDRVGLLR